MAKIEGKYSHVSSENLDEFFKSVGVPYIPRKMMSMSNPTVEISKSGDDKWTITTTTTFRTTSYTFKLGEEYEEIMPGGSLKCRTTPEDGKLITVCFASTDGSETVRTYSASDDGLTVTYNHKKSQVVATRNFKRV